MKLEQLAVGRPQSLIGEVSAVKAIAGIRRAFKLIVYEGTASSLRLNPITCFLLLGSASGLNFSG